MTESKTPSVRLAFIQIVCPNYKYTFFKKINDLENVKLTLFVGDKNPPTIAENANLTDLPHIQVKNYMLTIFNLTFVWQKLSAVLDPKEYDLIILSDGVLYLSNYITMIRCWFHGVPFGLYSHGFNHQHRDTIFAKVIERIRAFIHRRCDIMIVYSDTGAKYVINKNKVPKERVFVAKNTIDVKSIIKRSANFTSSEITKYRLNIGVDSDDLLLAYIGRIHQYKNPEWLLEIVYRLRNKGLPVKVLYLSELKECSKLMNLVKIYPQDIRESVKFIGYKPIEEVDKYLIASDITIMPGMTGLAIVHSFAVGRPFVTINSVYHSPEIEHLNNFENGIMVGNNIDELCNVISFLYQYKDVRIQLGRNGLQYAKKNLLMEDQLNAIRQSIQYIENSKGFVQ